jgi:hypothetical protein
VATGTVKFEGKSNICSKQKDTNLCVDGDEVALASEFHNVEIHKHDVKSSAGTTANFVHRTP